MSDRSPTLRLLVVVNVYRPDLGGGVLFADLCEGLTARGIDVTVKCAYSYYPEWADKSGRNGFTVEKTSENGVRIERHGLYIPGNPNSLLQRLIYEGSFYLSLRRRRPRPAEFDAVMVFCPLVGAVAYASAAARRTRAPLWLNVQDLSAQAARAGGIAGSLGSILSGIQNAVFRLADVWTTISDAMARELERIPGAPATVHVLPNWLHASLAAHIEEVGSKPTMDDRTLPADHPLWPGASQPVRLLYSGNVGTKQDLMSFCRRLSATDTDFHLAVRAAGARADELAGWIESSGDARFSMEGLMDERGLAEALRDADAYVITEKAGAGSSFVPSKLIPGLSSGTPILSVCDPDGPLGREVRAFDVGPAFTWDELSGPEGAVRLGEEIRRFAADAGAVRSWRREAARRSDFYSREAALDRYEHFLRQIVLRENSQSTRATRTHG